MLLVMLIYQLVASSTLINKHSRVFGLNRHIARTIMDDRTAPSLSQPSKRSRLYMSQLSDANEPLQVLYQSDDFLAINKPYDVRMDGEYDLSMDKLLMNQFGGSRENYKWIHQLDFATSGVLLIGLNRNAAASGSNAFANRRTYKEYSALVYGHLCIDLIQSVPEESIPTIREDVNRQLEGLKTQNLAAKDAAAAIDSESKSTWQDNAREHGLKECLENLKKIDSSTLTEQQQQELSTFLATSEAAYLKGYKLRKKLRKFLKNCNMLPNTLEGKEKIFCDEYLSAKSNEEETKPLTLSSSSILNLDWPKGLNIYRFHSSETGRERILVLAPLAEIPNEFSCEFGHPDNPGRYAETEVDILGCGYYNGQCVTRLRLILRTGRRHQLRLHCLALGAPIVGDTTYASPTLRPEEAHRMMLHSLRLR